MKSLFNPRNIHSIEVYIERRSRRSLVGILKAPSKEQLEYSFEYNEFYFKDRHSIALGPEFPLTQRQFKCHTMFASLMDRIPSRQNPAYPEYCQAVGIDTEEQNPMTLLGTLGRKAPSSFVLEPVYEFTFCAEDLKQFRKHLGLSIREFAELFDTAYASIARIEDHQSSGKDLLKRIELYARIPEAAQFELQRRGRVLTDEKRELVAKRLAGLR